MEQKEAKSRARTRREQGGHRSSSFEDSRGPAFAYVRGRTACIEATSAPGDDWIGLTRAAAIEDRGELNSALWIKAVSELPRHVLPFFPSSPPAWQKV